MRLIIEGFNKGLIDETTITKMGLAQVTGGLSNQELRIEGCPATDINAMDFYTVFALNKMNGREALNLTPWKDSAIIKMYQWQDPTAKEFSLLFSCLSAAVSASIAVVAVSGGSTTFSTVSFSGTPLSGWAPEIGDGIDITAYAGSAVMTYGDNTMPLMLFTGSSYITPMLGTNAPSGAKTVAAWGSYLFAGNIITSSARDRSRIVWNQPLDPTSWLASNYIDLDVEDGDVITAMRVYKDLLMVFKRHKTFLIKYVGGTSLFDWQRIDNSVGCIGPNALCESEGILYFRGADDFYSFDGTNVPRAISSNIKKLVARDNTDVDYVNEVVSFGDKKQIFFTEAEGSSLRKNKIYIYDIERKGWTKWDVEVSCLGNMLYGHNLEFIDFPDAYETYSNIIGNTVGGTKNTFLAFGTYGGYLQRFGTSDNDLGQAINAYWVSPWIDFGYPDRNKRILRVTVFLDATGDLEYTLDFTAYTDWDGATEAMSKTFTTTGPLLGIAEKRIDFTLPCRALKFKLGINQLNASVTIHKIIIDFLIKGRTLVQ
jgi:hypothetical protein